VCGGATWEEGGGAVQAAALAMCSTSAPTPVFLFLFQATAAAMRVSLLVLALVVVVLLATFGGADARRARAARPEPAKAATPAPKPAAATASATKPGYRVNVQEYEKLLPRRGNRRSPLPHDITAPNGGAPWKGGDRFEARPNGQDTRPIPLRAPDDGPVAMTEYGAVQGYVDDGVNHWRGIPYAAPPVGEFRFREPQDALKWQGVREAVEEGPICPQIKIFDWLYAGNEDCLYLDVYAPADASPTNLKPVFVWIYGGAWILGDAYEFGLYDGHNVVNARDYVIVAMNYRLGPLGFMANDAMRAENPLGTAGNFALLDQLKALEWVRDNVAAFGGDPKQVTIGGESAGGFSVCWHLASPLSAGLFHGAIIESGTCSDDNFFISYELSRNWTNTYTTMLGCDPNAPDGGLTCLRNMETGDIMGNLLGAGAGHTVQENMQSIRQKHADLFSAEGGQSGLGNQSWGYHPRLFPLMSWAATIDGVSLPAMPLTQIESGNFNAVPTIAGTNNDEGTLFVPMMFLIVPGVHLPVEASDLPIAMDHFFNNATITAMIEAEYPVANYSSAEECFNDILRDFMFVSSARRALRAMNKHNVSTWLYHWYYKGDWIDDYILGDYHAAELEFVWDTPIPLLHPFSDNDNAMANTVDTYWSNMVWTGTPNGNALASRTGALRDEEYWMQYDDENMADMVLAVPTQLERDYFESKCEFWDMALGYNNGKE